MDNLVYLNNTHSLDSFTGDLKVSPQDFKVFEISLSGLVCGQNSRVATQSPRNTEKQPSGLLQKSPGKCFVDAPPPPAPGGQRTGTAECTQEFCENKLSDLLVATALDKLKAFGEQVLTNPALIAQVDLGEFPSKRDRVILHQSIKFLFPQLLSATKNKSQVIVSACDKYSKFSELLDHQEASNFIKFACVKSREENTKQYDIKGTFDKDARRKIHHAIDEHFGRFLEAKTQPGYGPESVIRVRLRKKKSAAQSSFNDGFRYCRFVLCKENMETHDAINALSRHLHLRPHQFAFAGLKDKRAQTWQHLTVEGISCKKLTSLSAQLPKRMRVTDVVNASSALRRGDLTGNRFVVVVRNLRPISDRSSGRAGIPFPAAHQQLAAALKRQVQAAVDRVQRSAVEILLRPNFDIHPSAASPAETAKMHLNETGDIEGALKLMPTSRARDVGILRALRKFGANIRTLSGSSRPAANSGQETPSDVAPSHFDRSDDAAAATSRARTTQLNERQTSQGPDASAEKTTPGRSGDRAAPHRDPPDPVASSAGEADQRPFVKALLSMPHYAITLYLHAYCSLIWNRVASERLRRHGCRVVEGDFVASEDDEGGSRDQVHVVTAEDLTLERFHLRDVILPLPGHKSVYPTHLEQLYTQMLEADGLLSTHNNSTGGVFRVNQLKLNIPGANRKLIEYPGNLNYRWLPALCIKQVKEETDESSRTTAGFKAAKPSIECGCRGNAVVVGAVRDKGESCAHLLPCETNGTACSACEADPNAASEPDAKRAKPEFDAGADEPVCAERTSEAQQVVGSNPARSNGGETPEASPQGQALNLQLFFDLPPSCYATSLLRELSMGGVA